MTDRGISGTDRAAACPFVAFEDDRDARSTAPDHRHRCFAEPVPAPRAIAHQDAYCLSPAFAVCPAFQDWARREAAAARPASPAAAPAPAAWQREREDDTSAPVPLPPAEREPRHAAPAVAQPLPPRKAPPRDWAAPPPWVAEGSADESEADASTGGGAHGAIPGWNAGAIGGAAAVGGAAASGAAAAAARARGDDDRRNEGRGLADSAAARIAGPDPGLPAPARPTTSWADGSGDLDEDGAAYAPARPQMPPARSGPARSAAPDRGRPTPAPRAIPTREAPRHVPMDAQELFGPAWERPRRYEAYPSLRTRVGLPSLAGVPRIGIAAVALVIAAAFLFFVSPMLLGLGKHGTTEPSAPLASAASAAPSDTPIPTIAPAPTPFTYTIVKGDTVSGIATKFGVTVKALQQANPAKLKNINAIHEGDQITIPVPTGGSGVTGASPSAVSGASAGP